MIDYRLENSSVLKIERYRYLKSFNLDFFQLFLFSQSLHFRILKSIRHITSDYLTVERTVDTTSFENSSRN